MNDWFEVDKDGLAQILERKGKEFALFELVQNAWDEPGVAHVCIDLSPSGRGKARVHGTELSAGDAVGLSDEPLVRIEALDASEILVFDLA